ncbi:uncharacterized protein LOC143222156 isoform X5 [Tachypleus tridentatus]|uniref:uncharacterized protein LOC143222156 isoform X5 n=1 Tax=Tachypleus tridentatus TaxID=6853 RepID=UPI003FCF3E22
MSSSSGIMCFVLLCVNFVSSTQECNMNQAINRTTECTRTFSKRIGSSTQSLTKNPEKLCCSSMATKQFSITRVSVSWKPAKQMRRKKQVVPNLHNFL